MKTQRKMENESLFSSAGIGALLFLIQPLTASAAVDTSLLSIEGPSGNGVRAGPFMVFPTLALGAQYDTNYLQTSERPQSTWVYTAAPAIKATAERLADSYSLFYRATLTKVAYDSDYDSLGQEVTAKGKWELGLRHHLTGEYGFTRGYDPPGTGNPDLGSRPNFSNSLDAWYWNRVGGTYTYGAPRAPGRLEFEAKQTWWRYDNNNQEYRSYNETDLVGRFFVRVQPKTYMLLELGNSAVSYVNQGSDILGYSDQNQPHAYLGLTWEATGKTTGTAKVGYLAVNYKDSRYSDWSGIGWNVGLTWKPKTYSTLSVNTSRTPQQSGETTSDVVIVSALTLGWTHAWGSRLSSNLGGYLTADDYQGIADRVDHRYGISVGVAYSLRNWVQLGASYRYEDRRSDVPVDEYTDNLFMVTADLRY